MTLGLGIIAVAIIILLILSAFFSGSETAVTATSRARMHELEKRGNLRARTVRHLIEKPQRLIGAILLGNNMVNILASALATSLFLKLFGPVGVVYATLVMTALVLIFGEVMPKTYAIINPDRYALFVAPMIKILVALFAPMVSAVEYIAKNSMKLVGIDISKAEAILSAREELRGAINLHHKEGSVIKRDRDMLGGVLDLSELEISDVMIHRTKMKMVDIARTPSQIIDDILSSGHSRMPVYEGDTDNIIGIIHAKNLLAQMQATGGKADKINIRNICAKPWFVPDTTLVPDQLNAFLRRKTHFAIVVDEYGELMGLVTLEDILEEIVGDIEDEHDVSHSGIAPQEDGSFIIEGTTPIRDINRQNDWDLPDDEATTIAGLVIHEARMIPDIGQAFTFYGFRIEILGKQRHQLTSLRVTRI